MNINKLISIIIIGLSILILFARPFGSGKIIDDHYRTPPWQEMIFLFTFLFGIYMYPTKTVPNSSLKETEI